MPLTSTAVALRRVWRVADRVGELLVPAARIVGHVGLLMLILSGEAIRWIDYRDTLVSAPMLRSIHVFAGFLLLGALLVRVGDPLVQFGVRTLRVASHLSRPASLNQQGPDRIGRLLDGVWWAVVLLLVLSGLERYAQLRYGDGILPWFSPTAWWALHRPLLPFLYVVLLSNALIRGRILVRQLLSYLYTP